ncbi:ribosomal protein S18-alanine N-acetyltransferase [Aliibacillus thermotolerans]|uniref:Ribosomal protein S18-alanine N-acetyltransferase n=1 Tax=Aliibacillus thermotolerans TaxID=1834418 RepID=A0ABW0U8C9_9BACI|nr:ribosomal protein S18-alanine N-acetyltransferase [Aliibacillus thermotolerans]MDA3130458.1 ribosomal-protein-alanine N-acetyltransferase [Aliibacillus thermotolerans]
MNDALHIRLMELEDIEDVLKVEHDAFSIPWTRSAFVRELTENPFAHYIVAEWEEEIVGYCGVWVIADQASITNIAVHSEYRGRQIGETLLRSALEMALFAKAESLSLEVRMSNVVAQSLYKKLGFQEGGIRKKYYTDNLEDALVMWVKLDEYKRKYRNNFSYRNEL